MPEGKGTYGNKRGRPKKQPTDDPPMEDTPKGKKTPATKSKGGGDWKGHLAKTFAQGKKKNPNYKYSQAMKDAAKTYKGKKK